MITIAGGGLAGLSLGIALRQRDIPVTIHESGSYPRHRVCGEFISGVSTRTLRALGIADILLPARLEKSSAWYVAERLISRQVLPVAAMGISRYSLDESLQSRFADLGGTLRTNSRLSCDPAPGLVWSTGRRPVKGAWIGLKCHVRAYKMQHDLEMFLGQGGYVGLAQLDADIVNVCGLFRLRRDIRGEDTLGAYLAASGLGKLGQRLAEAQTVPGSSSAVAGFEIGWQKNPAGLFAIGDSLAMIPPFSGNGMSMAFESAESAIEPLCAFSEGKLTWNSAQINVQKALGRRFRGRLILARILHPFLTSTEGQAFFAGAARTGLLPFGPIFKLLR